MLTNKAQTLITVGITIVGCFGMVGDLFNSNILKGIGAASAIAPMPKVFCDNNGLEGFASEFTLSLETTNGTSKLQITPEVYSKLRGPYNRRNVYGAVLSYGPKLPEDLTRAGFEYAFGSEGRLLEELGVLNPVDKVELEIKTKSRGRNDCWTLSTKPNEN